jgi:hypothetical protein
VTGNPLVAVTPQHASFRRESLGGGTVKPLPAVPDPAEVVARTVGLGACEVPPVAEAHGRRLGRIEGSFGHHREIGEPLGDRPRSR